MPDGQQIEFHHVTKRFGEVVAVSDFSARVNAGVVTGFLGPNGAGKTTTLRMLLGLERPTIGEAKIGGQRYSDLRQPARVIGAMLENPGFRPRRTVERHLIIAAKANDVPLARVGELIAFVGLGADAETRVAALSLGMRQRLSAAIALMGDPGVLVLDEPANGLDPEGIRWMRTLIRGLADEGRTVLVSSHVLSEVEQIADEILVIARGELKFAGTMEDLADPRTGPVIVDAVDRGALSDALRASGFTFEILRSGLTVRGSDAATIGGVTTSAGVPLTTLQQRGPTLEDVFLDLVNDRYVPVEARVVAAPVADSTTALPIVADEDPGEPTAGDDVLASDEAGLRLPAVAPPVSPAATLSPSLDDPAAEVPAEPRAEADDSDDDDADVAAPAAELPGGATRRSERALRADAASADAEPDERPLPGIAGLAAVAGAVTSPGVALQASIDAAGDVAENDTSLAHEDADAAGENAAAGETAGVKDIGDADQSRDAAADDAEATTDGESGAGDADVDDAAEPGDATRLLDLIAAADAEGELAHDDTIADAESAATEPDAGTEPDDATRVLPTITEPDTDDDAAGTDAAADPAEGTDADPADEATRVLPMVTASDDAASGVPSSDDADTAGDFFDALVGDPASDDDDVDLAEGDEQKG